MAWFESFRLTPLWWHSQGDIVVSSRARLVRNIEGNKFPARLTDEEKSKIAEEVKLSLKDHVKEFKYVYVDTDTKRDFFTERHILNRDSNKNSHIFTSEMEEEAYIINDRDHLRIQSTLPDFSLSEVFSIVRQRIRMLERELNFSYSETFGYLSSSLTNTGTGLRLSVLMFLPGVFFARETEKILALLVKAPIVLRGLFGEKSEIKGNFIQISTKFTLGVTMEDSLRMLEEVAKALTETEKRSRDALLANARMEIEDRVARSLALLESARLMSYDEALEHLSVVKFAAQLGFEGVPEERIINKLLLWISPVHLVALNSFEVKDEEVDIKRAELLRKWLSGENGY